jgi:hypothetical protein
MKFILMLLGMALVSAGCAHQALHAPPPSGDRIYPYGVYQHKVEIHIIDPPRDFALKGVVKFQPEGLNVVGLSNFGTTVFRITENFKTGEIKKDFYLEIMKQNSQRFEYFYSLIRELLLTPKNTTRFTKNGAKFTLSRPDENQIYRHAHIEHSQFILDIEVTDYDY